jgi:hypothetical protein
MQHRQAAEPAPEVARIAGELLQGRRGTLHQQAIDGPRVGARQGPQFGRQREGEQVVAAGQQTGALLGEPALGLVPVTLRTGAVAAGVVRIDRVPALIALMDVTSTGWRPAGFDIPQGPALTGRQGRAEPGAVRRPVEADDVGHLQHEDLRPRIRGLS